MGAFDPAQSYFDEIMECFREFEEWCPGIVGSVARLLIGDIPQARELDLYRLADSYERAAQTLSEHLDAIVPVGAVVTGGWLGDGAAAAFSTGWNDHVGQVSATLDGLNRTAELVRQSALSVETMKFVAATNLFMLAQAIFSLIMAAFFTFGLSTVGFAPALFAAEVGIKTAARELLEKLTLAGTRAAVRDTLVVAGRDGAATAARGFVEQGLRGAAGRSAGSQAARQAFSAGETGVVRALIAGGRQGALTTVTERAVAAKAARAAAIREFSESKGMSEVSRQLLHDALARGRNFAGFTLALDGGIQGYQVLDGHRTGLDVGEIAAQTGAATAIGLVGSPFSLGRRGMLGEAAAMSSGTVIFTAANNIYHGNPFNQGLSSALQHSLAYGIMGGAHHDAARLHEQVLAKDVPAGERPAEPGARTDRTAGQEAAGPTPARADLTGAAPEPAGLTLARADLGRPEVPAVERAPADIATGTGPNVPAGPEPGGHPAHPETAGGVHDQPAHAPDSGRTTAAPARPESTRPEDAPHPEPGRLEPARPDPTHAEPTRAESTTAEPGRPDPAHSDAARTEGPHADPVRPEPTHAEPVRADPTGKESAHTESGRADPAPREVSADRPHDTPPQQRPPDVAHVETARADATTRPDGASDLGHPPTHDPAGPHPQAARPTHDVGGGISVERYHRSSEASFETTHLDGARNEIDNVPQEVHRPDTPLIRPDGSGTEQLRGDDLRPPGGSDTTSPYASTPESGVPPRSDGSRAVDETIREMNLVHEDAVAALTESYEVFTEFHAPFITKLAAEMLVDLRADVAQDPGRKIIFVGRDGGSLALATRALDPAFYNEHCTEIVLSRAVVESAVQDLENNAGEEFHGIDSFRGARGKVVKTEIDGSFFRLSRYLQNNEVPVGEPGGSVTLVDTSYKGTVQELLAAIFPETSFRGRFAFFGAAPEDPHPGTKFGYALHLDPDPNNGLPTAQLSPDWSQTFSNKDAVASIEELFHGPLGSPRSVGPNGPNQELQRSENSPLAGLNPTHISALYTDAAIREGVKRIALRAVEDFALHAASESSHEAVIEQAQTYIVELRNWISGDPTTQAFRSLMDSFVRRVDRREIDALVDAIAQRTVDPQFETHVWNAYNEAQNIQEKREFVSNFLATGTSGVSADG